MINRIKSIGLISVSVNKPVYRAVPVLYQNLTFSRPAIQNNQNVYRMYSATPPPQRPPSFIGKMVDNFREEFERNKKLKQNIKEFRKDMNEIHDSESIKKAREKFRVIEEETAEGTQKAKQQLDALKKKMQDTELLQKASRTAEKVTEEASKQAMEMGKTISEKGEKLAKTQTYKTISDTAKLVRDEIDQTTFGRGTRVYRPPQELKMRVDRDVDAESKVIEANAEASGMVLHKDSKFSQSWDNFRDNNPYINRVMEWRTKLDESDNPIVRASMLIKDKATELFGGVFQRTELSEVLTEICKMDPNFDKERFLLECEYFIIPNVLEAMIRPDLKILKDWCYERAYSVIATQVKQVSQLGLQIESKVLDVDLVDLVMGKVMDEGPVLAISFQSQQIVCIRNSKNEVVEGDPNKVLRVNYVWVMCRDQTELNAHAAWRLLDLSAQSTEQFV